MIWYKEKQQGADDIMVSTRIRLARNLAKYPFPNAMTTEQAKKAAQEISASILEGNSTLAQEFRQLDFSSMTEVDKQTLYEQHLASPEMLNRKAGSLLLSKDETMSIMLMEEDHIRLQIILGGFQLDKAWELADKVDDVIEEHVEYAFDDEFGYLTSCPTNTGTGLRASVMMHLPALTMTDSMARIINSAGQLGIAVRGMYGEGSKAYGNLYQISNQITLGATERDIIEKLKNIANQIADQERQVRKSLAEHSGVKLADRLWRSYGTLKYARSVSSQEAKALISDVILGKNMQIIDSTPESIWELMVTTEPAFITQRAGKAVTPEQRDQLRADAIRNCFTAKECERL